MHRVPPSAQKKTVEALTDKQFIPMPHKPHVVPFVNDAFSWKLKESKGRLVVWCKRACLYSYRSVCFDHFVGLTCQSDLF